ncbi:ankyrin repeat and SOCS box protein 2 [Tachyglossus aculeatus]|uniref:ankyrin repeat and SOCS box protein 2 n=1 Tax=Tachyglossus aculeatus TaxID=9261 RepID=UPI0018F33E36|nr:ankyrin repeat and SOCS box protein 2 [Tachyglossus aculeatus]
MAMEVTPARAQRAIDHEEYSLYSSMSEDELIQMAIEQSLTENSPGQPASASYQKPHVTAPGETALPNRSNRPPAHFYPCTRSAASPGNQSQPSTAGLFQGVKQRYNSSLFNNTQPVVIDPVVAAIKKGDENALTSMIQSGKNLSEPNKDGWLPLHEAAYYGQLGCLKILHRAYPTVIDQRTLQEETALYLAICRGNLDCALSLLQCGAEPDISNKSRETPLYKACERKNVEAVRMLVQYNADTNHRCNRGWTALHEAVARNDLEVMDILVNGGAKVESKNAYGITPLFVAAQSGQLDALRFLAKHGADFNTQASDGASALYEACKNEHVLVVEFLLAQGADANKVNKDGLLPLHIASKRGNHRIVQMLLPVTSRTRVKRSGVSPLHLAAERNNDAVLDELLEAGYEVNAILSPERSRLYEDRRTTALYFAVINNNVYASEQLLRAGANPNLDMINPLLISIRHGCLKTIRLLLDHGANIDAYISSHPTTFPAAIMFSMKCLSLLKFLMDLGCDGHACFKCQYGNGPHPNPKAMANRFNDVPLDKSPSVVQFCEIISAPEVSRWAGPIIDVLLDYVGNVQLCARLKEHIESYEEWAVIREKAEPPRPLAHLCRLRVRKAIGKNRIKLIDTLPLPGRLIRYLQHDNSQ